GERRPALRHLAKTNNVCQFKSKLFQQKREAAALGRYRLAAELQALRHAADHCPHEAGAGPSHALQHPPPVRIYIAFFGHSSLLVAIGVWVMSAISLCDNSSSSRRISGSRSSTGNAAVSSCTCRSPPRR